MITDEIKTNILFKRFPAILCDLLTKIEYPWEALDKIGEYIKDRRDRLYSLGYTEINANVFVGKNVIISDTAKIIAPAIIGSNTEIRHCAYIRGNAIIGENCVIGNSTEIKNSIIFDNVQLPHYNYVGDSIIGYKAHLGAGAICSNVKQDKSTITVKSEPPIKTGKMKLGAIICDNVEIGCGAVINPGSIICSYTRIYPLCSVRGIIKPQSIIKTNGEINSIK